ncbi:MAG: hypothetical protein CVU43_04625 [Chloroflexi bacterium HGW-Chloroflexi-5]|jgi:hypothetical protein|nr:MAG: hypothetical protein CVU43_04625 [Chloroflexi bacterium HGW-Chloroflexi-5]
MKTDSMNFVNFVNFERGLGNVLCFCSLNSQKVTTKHLISSGFWASKFTSSLFYFFGNFSTQNITDLYLKRLKTGEYMNSMNIYMGQSVFMPCS